MIRKEIDSLVYYARKGKGGLTGVRSISTGPVKGIPRRTTQFDSHFWGDAKGRKEATDRRNTSDVRNGGKKKRTFLGRMREKRSDSFYGEEEAWKPAEGEPSEKKSLTHEMGTKPKKEKGIRNSKDGSKERPMVN